MHWGFQPTEWVGFSLKQKTAADWEKSLFQLKSCVGAGLVGPAA